MWRRRQAWEERGLMSPFPCSLRLLPHCPCEEKPKSHPHHLPKLGNPASFLLSLDPSEGRVLWNAECLGQPRPCPPSAGPLLTAFPVLGGGSPAHTFSSFLPSVRSCLRPCDSFNPRGIPQLTCPVHFSRERASPHH